jgi:hypothetical protein
MMARKKKSEYPNSNVVWIDFDKLKQYTKQLPQALTAEELIDEIKFYLATNERYNVYGLATHLMMSKHRFTTQYLQSKDPQIAMIAQWAVDTITNHAMKNEEDYKRTLKYMIAQSEVGKSFIELSEEVKQAEAKVLILPEKDIDDDK